MVRLSRAESRAMRTPFRRFAVLSVEAPALFGLAGDGEPRRADL